MAGNKRNKRPGRQRASKFDFGLSPLAMKAGQQVGSERQEEDEEEEEGDVEFLKTVQQIGRQSAKRQERNWDR
jgi:hypothetical protein